jgi:hypothetical protein
MTTQDAENHAMSSTEFSNPVIRWIDYRLPIFTFLHHELNVYPTPRNLNYLWNFGSLWRAHHEAWKRSDLNQRQYCEAEDIPLRAFGNWRTKFKAEPQPPS